MKKFLKIVSIVLVISLIACFAACGGNETPDTDNDQQVEKLVMATNASFPPYEYKEGDEIVGIDAEIAAAIAKELGMELEIVDTEFGSIIGGVQSGKYDMGMAGMTVTPDRLESVNFSNVYAHGVQAVIVAEDSEYNSYEDFYTGFGENEDGDTIPTGVKEGVKIGVQQDTTGDIYSSSELKDWGFLEENVVRYKTGNEAVLALKSGKVTAVIIDNEPAKSYVAATEGLKILEGSYVEEDYAICVAKDNTELLDKINAALVKLTEDGTIPAIIERYIPSEG